MNKGLKIGLIAGGSVLLLGGAALFLWLKFGKTDAHLRLIPKEATTVAVINVRNLFSKADPKKLMMLPIFKQQTSGSLSPEMKRLMQDPTDLGADITQNIAGFINQQDGVTTSGLVFKISDGSRFASVIAKLGGYARPNKVDGLWYIPIESNVGLCWNDEAGVLFTGSSLVDESTQQQAERLLRQPKEYSILDNPNYKAFAAQDFDIGLMVDNNVVQRSAESNDWMGIYNMFGSPTGWSDLLINFEDETIDFKSTVHQPEGQASVLRTTGPDAKHLEAFADKDPIGFICAAIDLKALVMQLNADANMKRNLEEMEDALGIPVNEIIRSFTGDVSMAFTDYRDLVSEDPVLKEKMDKMREIYQSFNSKFDDAGFDSDEYDYPTEVKVPVFVLNLSITDTVTPGKLIRQANMSKTADGFYSGATGMGANVYAAMKGSHLIITNSYGTAAQLMRTGKLGGKPSKDIDVKKPASGRLEMTTSKYPSMLTDVMKDEMGDRGYRNYTLAAEPLQYVSLSSEGNTNLLQVHVKQGEGNSLYRLIVHTAETVSKF
ncbi:MAG: DUF4836 family protein [Bacteroidota bacterium]|jgi:hypothetical protein